jgi:hypothetical protein
VVRSPRVGILKGRAITIPEMKSEDFSISPSIFENCDGLLRVRDRAAASAPVFIDDSSLGDSSLGN